jgi:type I restriction enzyme M protein
LIFTKGGTTERVWFYDLQADGYSLDDKRTLLKGEGSDDLPDAVAQWKKYRALVEANAPAVEIERDFGDKTRKAFVVVANAISDNKYDLSINRYKEVVYGEEEYEDPRLILTKLKYLEAEIMADLDGLEDML